MSFTPLIPASGQTLGNSRPQVLNNFASLRTTISNAMQPNHIDVNATGAGKHIFVQMPVQTEGAPNLPANNEGGLITETLNGNSELFYVRDAINTYFQMTGPFAMNIGSPTNGSVVLFGGLIMKWGQTVAGPVLFASAFLNNCFGVVAQYQTGGSAIVQAVTRSGFTLSGAGATGFYIALGN